jgi:hypothetical protein
VFIDLGGKAINVDGGMSIGLTEKTVELIDLKLPADIELPQQ